MIDVHGLVAAVEGSPAFVRFSGAAPARRLVHVFARGSDAEVGYYDPEADAITVFSTTAPIVASDAQEVFRDDRAPRGGLAGLDLTCVSIGLDGARSRASRLLAAAHPVAQEILILQQRDGVPVWVVTLLTHTLHVLIVRLDARDGSVQSSEFRNVLDLRAPE